MPAATQRRQPDTLADVLRRLGDIPPHRILWNPFPGTATEADQLRYVEGHPKRLVELVDGVLVEKAMGTRESFMAATLIAILMGFVRPRRLGLVGAPDIILRVQKGRNRMPDVTFTSWERLPAADAHLQPVGDFVPELLVEILSESNTKREIARKRREYFKGGAKLVWVIEPEDRTVAVYTDPKTHTILTAADTLTGGDVLPGFSLPLADFFNDPQLNPRPLQG
jgi:Uma2 family endonuclease